MAVTKSYATTILSSMFNNQYIGLSTTEPNSDGTNYTEPSSSSGYGRVPVSKGGFTYTDGTATNTQYIYFPEAIESWGTATYLCIFTSQTGGTLRYYGALTTPKEIASGSVPLFRPNSINVSIVEG